MRPETWSAVKSADAILFGATGSPEYATIPSHHWLPDNLLRVRKELDLFCNLRPVRMAPLLSDLSTLRAEVIEGADLMLVRELSSGLYFNDPRGIVDLPGGGRRGFNTMAYTTAEVERIARAAFELARGRQGRVCSVDKANVLEVSMLWREVVQSVHDQEFPDVELQHLYVDNAAMQLVKAPKKLDVVVTGNMFGDILSDEAAMLTGSIGMLPSASLDANNKGLYEPSHGSAPDIAGKGIANPLATILSAAMMLRYTLQQADAADRIESAVSSVLESGLRTTDIASAGMRTVGTREMGDAVVAAIRATATTTITKTTS
jgi:3-isopropylmalate dehydrogenase